MIIHCSNKFKNLTIPELQKISREFRKKNEERITSLQNRDPLKDLGPHNKGYDWEDTNMVLFMANKNNETQKKVAKIQKESLYVQNFIQDLIEKKTKRNLENPLEKLQNSQDEFGRLDQNSSKTLKTLKTSKTSDQELSTVSEKSTTQEESKQEESIQNEKSTQNKKKKKKRRN